MIDLFFYPAWKDASNQAIAEFRLRWIITAGSTVTIACFRWPVSDGAFWPIANDFGPWNVA
jgi:hypothetical protein